MNALDDAIKELEDLKAFLRSPDASERAAHRPSDAASCSAISDTDRMNWLVSMCVEVREPLLYGSRSLFHAQTLTDEEDEEHRTDLREKIDFFIRQNGQSADA